MNYSTAKESKLQKDCIDWLRAHHKDVLLCNIHGGGWSNKGFPDLLLCINGKFVTCELKVKDNQLQDDQIIWKKRIEDAGGLWYEIRDLDTFINIINKNKHRNKIITLQNNK